MRSCWRCSGCRCRRRRRRGGPVEAVVALDHGAAIAAEIEHHADARREHVPGVEVVLGEGLSLHRVGTHRRGELLLLRQPAEVATVAHAGVHRQRPLDQASLMNAPNASRLARAVRQSCAASAPVSHDASAGRRSPASRRRCCRSARCCCPAALIEAVPRPFLQQLGAHLERSGCRRRRRTSWRPRCTACDRDRAAGVGARLRDQPAGVAPEEVVGLLVSSGK